MGPEPYSSLLHFICWTSELQSVALLFQHGCSVFGASDRLYLTTSVGCRILRVPPVNHHTTPLLPSMANAIERIMLPF